MSSNPHKPRRRWFQFGLRQFFAFVAIMGVGLAIVVRWHDRAVRQRQAVLALTSHNGFNSVRYANGFDFDFYGDPSDRKWFQEIWDLNHLYDVVKVDLDGPTDEQLYCLRDLPELQSFYLSDGLYCTEAGLGELKSFPKLKHLVLSNTPEISDRTMEVIGSFKELERLVFESDLKVTDVGLAHLARLTKLRDLQLKCGLQTSDKGLETLGRLSNLKHLDLDLDEPSNGALLCFSGIGGTIPDFGFGELIRGHSIGWLRNLKGLKTLRLTGRFALADDATTASYELPNLTGLHIRAGRGDTGNVLAHLKNLDSLITLTLECGGGDNPDEQLANLATIPKLGILELRLDPRATDAGLASLAACKNLRRLKLHLNDQVTGEGLAGLKNLEYLEIDHRTRTEKAQPFNLCLPDNLNELVIDYSADLTDADIPRLIKLPKLQYLAFFWCKHLTDDGLEHLKQATGLKELGVHWCEQTTEGARNALKSSLPTCQFKSMNGGGSFGYSSRFHMPLSPPRD